VPRKNELESWEQTLLEELQEYSEKYLQLLKLQEGENKLVLYMDTLERVKTKFGEGIRITCEKGGMKYTLLIRRNSRLYKRLMGYLANIMRERKEIPKVLRVIIEKHGSGVNVDYNIREYDITEK